MRRKVLKTPEEFALEFYNSEFNYSDNIYDAADIKYSFISGYDRGYTRGYIQGNIDSLKNRREFLKERDNKLKKE